MSLLPGIGEELGQALVRRREREGPFRSWAEVGQVRGVTPEKLDTLMTNTVLEFEDAA